MNTDVFGQSNNPSESGPLTRASLLQAVRQHPTLQAADLRTDRERALLPAARNWQPGELTMYYGELQVPGIADYTLSATQRFAFPSVYGARTSVQEQQTRVAEAESRLTLADASRMALYDFYAWQQATQELRLLDDQIASWAEFLREIQMRVELGDAAPVEKLSGQTQLQMLQSQQRTTQGHQQALAQRLRYWTGNNRLPLPVDVQEARRPLPLVFDSLAFGPMSRVANSRLQLDAERVQLQHRENLPEWMLGYQIQSFERQGGAQVVWVGVSVPWATGAARSRSEAARLQYAAQEQLTNSLKQEENSQQRAAQQRLQALDDALRAFDVADIRTTDSLTTMARQLYRAGEIEYTDLRQHIQQAYERRRQQVALRREYEQTYTDYLFYTQNLLSE